jgi:hypothetical protein
MIEITDQITEDNYHLLFSAAEASRVVESETIIVRGKEYDDYIVTKFSVLFKASNIISLPNYLIIDTSLDFYHCHKLERIPNNLTVNGWLELYDCPLVTCQPLPDTLKVLEYIIVDRKSSDEFIRLNPVWTDRVRYY